MRTASYFLHYQSGSGKNFELTLPVMKSGQGGANLDQAKLTEDGDGLKGLSGQKHKLQRWGYVKDKLIDKDKEKW